ncbi:hypothetical protein [Pseudomonas soli]|uniref:Uncharacterized protein n=1 Tax=Pseudomonas soli TaxID=1306993 RepID=A0AAJ5MG50_9PSED|nr:hypothetical protein [Pseudomonas soli]UXZ43563.1 hypothetical protein K7K07_15920 [Pseudomonas soli]
MALTSKQRDDKRKEKEAKAGVEELRMKTRAGTRQALADIMQWAEVEENGEAMTLLIHRIHELGPEAARHFLSAPRHEIKLSSSVVRKLDKFRLSRELREPGLELGEDPDDTGLMLLAERA